MNTAKVVPVLVLCVLATTGWLSLKSARQNGRKEFTGVPLTGVHHMGRNFQIAEFYVDGYSGGNVGREGGGGSDVCCVQLAKVWRRDMKVEIRWSVSDWERENPDETDRGNYSSVSYSNYKAIVPVEKYDKPHHVYVHFFNGGRVRIISSGDYPESSDHPIVESDSHAIESATVGTRVAKIFTEAELESLRTKVDVGSGHGWR